MIKLLLADDEPLVLVGMQSMLNWESLGIEVCATAHNGKQALDLIAQHQPEIVITDIKMPLMSGLELAKACRQQYGDLPVFIMLTSFEEFAFVKEAMHQDAVEYLVKLELTPQSLQTAVQTALKKLEKIQGTQAAMQSDAAASEHSLQVFQEKFFARLYNNLFENEEQFNRQSADLGLVFEADGYQLVACAIADTETKTAASQITLCTSTVKMVQDTISKFCPCYVSSQDMRHFNVVLCLGAQALAQEGYAQHIMQLAITNTMRYFSVQLLCSIGPVVSVPMRIAESAHIARFGLPMATKSEPLFVAKATETGNDFFAAMRPQLIRAFEELDSDALDAAITQVVAHLSEAPAQNLIAMDVAGSLLYMAITFVPDGEATMQQVFADVPDGYRSLYTFTTTSQCSNWMLCLRDGLCSVLRDQHKSYKQRVVLEVEQYIQQNIHRKLSLNEVAAAFNFSPNYLSQLFAKYAKRGFVDTITHEKMKVAKRLLKQGNYKIYEVSEQLGYESSFYFSKVFKKETGLSPREYLQNKTG